MNEYSKIWPEGKKCAVMLSVNLDAEFYGRIYYPGINVDEGDIMRLGKTGMEFGLPRLLDTLDNYGVKATFFIIGKEGGGAAEIYRRIISDGHAAGNHTYSHEYNEIYASEDRFWEEYRKNDETFFELTGRHLEIMRFPGGSNNTVSERYCRGIMKRLSGVKDKKTSIILMHDNKTKTTTVEALPTIIEELKKQGCIFKTLNKDTEPIQFLK